MAKRLESLVCERFSAQSTCRVFAVDVGLTVVASVQQGALTHGDRRATETRDLSRFNFDNKVSATCWLFHGIGVSIVKSVKAKTFKNRGSAFGFEVAVFDHARLEFLAPCYLI